MSETPCYTAANIFAFKFSFNSGITGNNNSNAILELAEHVFLLRLIN